MISATLFTTALVAMTTAVSAQSGFLERRQEGLVCYEAGFDNPVQIREVPVLINQYFGSNTVININGGITINISNAPTQVSTVVTATSTETVTATQAASGAADPFVLVVSNIAVARRQTANKLYVGANGQTVSSCAAATSFLRNARSQVFTDSTPRLQISNDGRPFQQLAPSISIGNITTSFIASPAGFRWVNAAFDGGEAKFCFFDGSVYAVLTGSGPVGCIGVAITTLAKSQCTDLTGGSTAIASSTAPSTRNTTLAITSTGSASSMLPSITSTVTARLSLNLSMISSTSSAGTSVTTLMA